LIVSTLFAGGTAGAEKSPVAEIVPNVALPPGMSFTNHVTVFGVIGT